MKSIKKIYIAFVSVILLIGACVNPDNLTPVQSEGGLLQIATPSFNLVVGEPKDYTMEYKVFQEEAIKTNKVDAYVRLYTYKRTENGSVYWHKETADATDSAKVAIQSNEKLLKSMDVTEALTHFVSFTFNLSDLTSDMEVADNEFYTTLPTADGDYLIGDYWGIRFVSTLSTGDVHESAKTSSVSVSTRFAGTYIASETAYLHPTAGTFYGEWDTQEKVIESVDATTYKLKYIAYASGGWDVEENELYFTVDEFDQVTVLTEYLGTALTLWGTDAVATCQDGTLPGIVCSETNYVEKMDDGADIIHIAYGYIRDTGTRQFSETLTKKIN